MTMIAESINFTHAAAGLAQPFRYTGREWDGATGLYYYRERYYSPILGSFISEDPIGLAGGINMYAYVGNNPVNFVDPLGLEKEKEKVVIDFFTCTHYAICENDYSRAHNECTFCSVTHVSLGKTTKKKPYEDSWADEEYTACMNQWCKDEGYAEGADVAKTQCRGEQEVKKKLKRPQKVPFARQPKKRVDAMCGSCHEVVWPEKKK